MGKKRFTPEQIISKLREAEVLQAKGETVESICRHLGITEQTYYRWRKEYGGIRVDQVKRLKDLEKENAQLRKLVANLSLDNSILKETLKGNY
jgi:transposase-like protein